VTRDEMMIDPALTERAQSEARRLAKSFAGDVVDAKEFYRTIVSVAVDYAIEAQRKE